MPPKVTPKNVPKKPGRVAGIPKWGWIAGAAIGLLIGYMLIKSSPGSASPLSPSGTGGSSPDPNSEAGSQQSAGNVPWDEIIKALGLRGGGQQTVPGDTSSVSTSQTNATSAAVDPGPQPGLIDSPSVSSAISPYTNISTTPDYVNPVYTPVVSDANPSSTLAYTPGTPETGFGFGAPVGTTGTVSIWQPGQNPSAPTVWAPNVDPSGHVVSPKGTRVGGVSADG